MEANRKEFLSIVLAVLFVVHKSDQARLHFTNIICNCTDHSYAQVDRCEFKALSRNVQYVAARVKVLHLPVTDITIRIQLMTRLKEWKPFVYEQIIRCNFTRSKNYLTRYVWNMVRNVSNIRTDCPYKQTVYELPPLRNTFVETALKKLPVPPGKFAVFITIQTYNITRGLLSFHVTLV